MATFELLGKDGAGHRSGARHRLCDGARARRSRRIGVDRGPRRRAGRGGRRADPRHARGGDRGGRDRPGRTPASRRHRDRAIRVARRAGRQCRHRLAPGDAAGDGPETVERILETNLFGVWRSVDAALPEIVARQGHIVVISSVYAFINGVGTIPYAMSKAAVEQLGRALRLELAPPARASASPTSASSTPR